MDQSGLDGALVTFKSELIYTRPWPTLVALRTATFEFRAGTTRRLHSSLGYRSPAEYEATIDHSAAGAA